jgi:hypothetical protein
LRLLLRRRHPPQPGTHPLSCLATFAMTMECCSASLMVFFFYGGRLAQFGLVIWILVDAINSLFKNDSTVECPGKVHDWTWWIFIWCILYVLQLNSTRNKDDKKFQDYLVEQGTLLILNMLGGLIFGLVSQYCFWNLCDNPLNDTVAKYMYFQYGMLAWSFITLSLTGLAGTLDSD